MAKPKTVIEEFGMVDRILESAGLSMSQRLDVVGIVTGLYGSLADLGMTPREFADGYEVVANARRGK